MTYSFLELLIFFLSTLVKMFIEWSLFLSTSKEMYVNIISNRNQSLKKKKKRKEIFIFTCFWYSCWKILFFFSTTFNFSYRHGICSSHLTLCLTLNFIFGYYSRARPDLKITVYIFCWYLPFTWPWGHGWKIFAQNLLNLVSAEREFHADQFLL